MNLTHLRLAVARAGLTPAAGVSESSGGRTEEATIRVAHLEESERLEWLPVPHRGDRWPDDVAFLDGVQRSEIVAYAGSMPIIAGSIAAGVQVRQDRSLRTAVVARRSLAMGRPEALAAAGAALTGWEPLPLPDDEAPHPVRDLLHAARALDRARGELELAVGTRYRAAANGWLVVDGSLSESVAWAADSRMVGIVKSHATLPFDGPELDRYLRLPAGCRTSIFSPASRSLAPVRAWALRLWPWEGRDLFHGFIRVEVAPANGHSEIADRISGWLLAERAPLSTPDPRWDRLLYGIHSVEQYLKVSR